jgi:uncharacterized DUF497 family protein
MIDWMRVTGFDWDEGNARKSADKHSVSQGEAEQAFFNEPLLVLRDDKHSLREPRFHALGETDDRRYLYITFPADTLGHESEHRSDRDPQTSDAGFAVHDSRIQGDSVNVHGLPQHFAR